MNDVRTITTDKGKTYEVGYAWAPLMDGSCFIAMQDARMLSEIAAEFEGLESIHYVDTDTGEYDFTGYTVLTGISRDGQGVKIKLAKGAAQ